MSKHRRTIRALVALVVASLALAGCVQQEEEAGGAEEPVVDEEPTGDAGAEDDVLVDEEDDAVGEDDDDLEDGEFEAEAEFDTTLAAGEQVKLNLTVNETVAKVESAFEIKAVGDAAQATLEIVAPNGTVVATKTVNLSAGEAMEFEVEHLFPEGAEAEAGEFTAILTAEQGQIAVDEGELEAATERGLDDDTDEL